MSLTDDLLSQLQGAPLQQVSQQLGLDPQKASGAISAALPLLMGALGRNSAQPDGPIKALAASPPAASNIAPLRQAISGSAVMVFLGSRPESQLQLAPRKALPPG